MDNQNIKIKLTENHNTFINYLNSLKRDAFLFSRNSKWTAGQQLEHIILGVRPLRQILSLPKFMLKLIWGKANRNSKSYEDLVNKYLQKLKDGGRASGRFTPKPVGFEERNYLIDKLQKEVESLCKKLDGYNEEELDKYIIPHPILGKLTIREMMYFTIYHVQHHKGLTEKNLK